MRLHKKRTAIVVGAAALCLAGTTTVYASGSPPSQSALPAAAAADVPDPEEFFGFPMGAEGRLAGYDDVLDYLKLIADESDRVDYETVGKTTMGNEYGTVLISSPENLENIDRLVEINQELSDPRNTTPEEARDLAAEGVPFHYVEATVHSTEVGNGQAINDIVYRLATEDSGFTDNVLANSVVVLVPSQNPDGQKLVIDHFKETAGTDLARVYPDLYHKYTGHDDNRDWTMFTQIESRYRLDLMKKYRPAMVHIMHQQGNRGERIFVPPYGGITSDNVPANMNASSAAIGQHAATALAAEDKTGVASLGYHIFWTLEQPVGYFPFTGSGLYLSEIASAVDLAYPQKSDDGGPLGPQTRRQSMIEPYDKSTWTLADIVDYAETAAYAGMEYTAQNGEKLQYDNLYEVPREYMTDGVPAGSYAFVVGAEQRDPYATFEMLQRLEWTDVEIDRASAPFTAGGHRYAEGSYVVKLKQPRGNWAHQVLGTDTYPEVRDCDTCPVLLPYAEASTSLPLQLGVSVAEVKDPFDAELERVESVEVPEVAVPEAPGKRGAYLMTPESYGTIQVVAALQDENITTFRAGKSFRKQGRTFPAGTYVIKATPQARSVLADATEQVGLPIEAVRRAPRVGGIQLKPQTKVGLLRGVNNMPGGWDMWVMDQYGIDYDVVKSQDYKSLRKLYDVIMLPHGISRDDIVEGLDPEKYAAKYLWAYGVGEKGWRQLRRFVRRGGTLLAVGSSVGTAKELLNLPIEERLPEDRSKFVAGGSLLNQHFDNEKMVAWGMPESWPIWFYDTQAYDVTGDAEVVSSYPTDGDVLASGYLRGADLIRGAANVVSFDVGKGTVVTYGSEVTFRTLPRSTFNLVYNAIYGGPAADVAAGQLRSLKSRFDAQGRLLR